MINNFDTEVAKEVGVNAAIIYFNIKYWCEYNRTNEQNEYEGLYWTYNSISAFEKQFEYFSAKQIRTALSVLEEHGYIKSGNFNKSAYDRTKWYADLRFNSEDKPTLPEEKIHFDKKANGDDEKGEPIPNINTNTIPNTKLIEKENIQKKERFDAFKEFSSVDEINNDPELLQTFKEFVDMRNEIKKPIKSMKGVNGILNELRRLSNGNHRMMIEIIKQSIDHEWCGVFEVKRQQTSNKNNNKNCFGEMMEREGVNPQEVIYGTGGDFNFT